MKIEQHSKSRGMAIFIVLISIAILAGMAFVFATQMKVETKLAFNSNNESALEWLGRSGIERGEYILALELTTPGPGQHFDALNQAWAHGQGETNDVLASISYSGTLPQGSFNVTKITDMESKFNINTSINNEALMTQALNLMGTDASEIPTIISCIQDWIDPDDETHPNGAESEYYQSLNPPYFAKNGPIDDMSELLLVKGITPDLYWGQNSTNHPTSMFQQKAPSTRSDVLPTATGSAGLVDVFTPFSSGQININTCSAIMLQMLGMDEASASRIISLRNETPFSSPTEIINAGLPQQLVSQFLPSLTVRSTTFEIQVDAECGMSKRRYFGLVRRDSPRSFHLLSFRWENVAH